MKANEVTVGSRFGKLVVIEIAETGIAICICDCGNKVRFTRSKLAKKDRGSCGCYFSGQSKFKGYRNWAAMKTRCTNPNADNYPRYGGAGIKVCKGFSDFKVFHHVMGEPTKDDLQIDRKKSEGNYSCGNCDECLQNGWDMNCKWSTIIEQNNNKKSIHKIELNGKIVNLEIAAKITGIKRATLNSRINTYGWSIHKAISTPLLKIKKVK